MEDIITELLNQEIDAFLLTISFKIEKDIDPSNNYLDFYLNSMAKELKDIEDIVLETINTPAYQEPLIKLRILQNTEIGELSKYPNLELVLPFELCSQMKLKLESLEIPARQIYLQMLFDCVNEALNYIRPFGLKGMPDP